MTYKIKLNPKARSEKIPAATGVRRLMSRRKLCRIWILSRRYNQTKYIKENWSNLQHHEAFLSTATPPKPPLASKLHETKIREQAKIVIVMTTTSAKNPGSPTKTSNNCSIKPKPQISSPKRKSESVSNPVKRTEWLSALAWKAQSQSRSSYTAKSKTTCKKRKPKRRPGITKKIKS